MVKQRDYPALVMPAGVERRTVKIWSRGVTLDADVYRSRSQTGTAPAIVLTHGWGGTKSTCERYAALFAARGFVALAFTHAGWGDSGSRAVVDGPEGRVRELREVVDPLEWIQGYRSAVDWIEGEPGVDPERIGAWGTSFGGGIAMYGAAHDARIKALAVQVAMVSKFHGPGGTAHARQRAIDLARGKLGPVALDVAPGLPGSVSLPAMLQYDVVEHLHGLTVPTLMMDAENEGFFDRKEHCLRAHAILEKRGVTTRYKVISGIDHYGIYFEGYEESSTSALAWFREHLAGRNA